MGSIVITLVLALIVGCIARSMLRNKKSGKAACGCNCAECKGCQR